MNKDLLNEIIRKGEGISIEFKESRTRLNRDVCETICAFLNRHGGHLLLGVEDDGIICGVNQDIISDIVNNIVILANNPEKLSPPVYLSPEIVEVKGEQVIYVYVPESSQVHNTAGKVFDRNDDGDFNVTENPSHIAQLYSRKQTAYSENMIFPFATIEDLRSDVIERVRKRVKNEKGGFHPWVEMSDEELLQSAQLFKKDLKQEKKALPWRQFSCLGQMMLF